MKLIAAIAALAVTMFTGCHSTGAAAEATPERIDDVQTLRDCLEAVRHRRQHPHKYRAITAELKAFLAAVKPTDRAADLPKAKRDQLRGLLDKALPIVEKTAKWDPGAYTLSKAREVRIARATAAKRQALWAKYLADRKAKGDKPASRSDWDKQWPRRIFFEQNFEKDGDWNGTVVTDNLPKGSTRAVAAVEGRKYYARRIRVGIYFDHARATTRNWVRLKYFSNKAVPITICVFDLTLRNNWAARIAKPVVGRWTEVTLDLAKFREKSSRRRKIRPGDALDDVFIFAGRPGDKELRLLVDDVQLIGQD